MKNIEKVIEKIEEIKKRDEAVSVSIAVVEKGKLIWNYASGLRDKENNIETDVDTIYRCASVSKHVSVLTTMTLVDKGLLNIDEDISKYLGYKVRNPYYPDVEITARMIMTQTSSLTEAVYSKICAGELPPYKLSEILPEDAPGYTKELYFNEKPGTYYFYNNFAYGILGTICEKLTGMRYAEYCYETVLKPLGIRGNYDPDKLDPNLNVAKPYEVGLDITPSDHNSSIEWLKKSLESKKMLMNLPIGESYRTTQGNLYIVPSDLAKIEIMLMNKGEYEGIRILTPESVNDMITAHFIDPLVEDRNTCLGLYESKKIVEGRSLIFHAGRAYGAINTFFDDFAKKDSVVCFTNGVKVKASTHNTMPTCEEIAKLIFENMD